ncbi:MAG TPA: energy transducer TonB [Steroidobacteraceae bacterium]|nr:energy transducer TonB [Steroidobacteraceae bacterium]
MARRALMLREGRAPVWDRLLAMLFFVALLHGVIILGLTFKSPIAGNDGAPGLQVLLVSDEVPTADRNDHATYLAQRTQLGSGNTREDVNPRNPAQAPVLPAQQGTPQGTALSSGAAAAGSLDGRVLTTSAWSTVVQYMTDQGSAGTAAQQPMLLDQQSAAQNGPEDDGPVQLRGPKRDELWVTPDTRAAIVAPYLVAWRAKVERIGTLNFPAAARQAGSNANPVIEVSIDADGRLDHASIRRASGDPELDQAALAILRLASPFDPFPPELARHYRTLNFVYEWQFVGGRLSTGTVTAAP